MPAHRSPPSRAAFERALQQLVGRCVSGVTYLEIAYEGRDQPMWDQASETFDSLDFGLQLALDDGSVRTFTWGTEFTSHNVSILQGPMEFAEGASPRRWDVGQRWRERGLIDSRIAAVRSEWLPSDRPPGREFPQDVRLEFESGAVVVISAFECRDGDCNWIEMDHITVFFDEAEAGRRVHGPVATV